MTSPWMKEFANPGSAYRGKPFWAWNGKLEPEELRRQIRVMSAMGLGGFFMHSRVGLDTPYLKPEWFRCVGACVDEARKLGMEAWLYDEDRWSSGAAGGLVTKNEKYRMRSLAVERHPRKRRPRWTPETVGIFAARVEGDAAYNVRSVPRGARKCALADGEQWVAFVVRLQPCSDWYNGYTYLDTLNPVAVRAFIRVTHEAYRRRFGAEFSRTIPGVFSDEPNHGSKLYIEPGVEHPEGLPWTGALPRVFRRRYGYDVLPHLMELVFDVDGNDMPPARYHYHDCVTHLYVDSFCRQIGEWCEGNGLAYTGHQLAEDSLSLQTNMVGSCMRTYEFMQAPGMDLLTEHLRVFHVAKQVSSAARQFGRKWRLTEIYGCTGWDFPFLGQKALGDSQTALGMNLRCQHLAWYTMQGQAKRDFPPSISYQSPWWPFYGLVEDYFARIHAVMTRGEEVRDLLVIHPVESTWMMVKTGWQKRPDVRAYDTAFERLARALLSAQLDFDYGDEEILSRHARVSREQEGARLRVGKAVYKAVLVPPLKTIRLSTLELLRRFDAAGGTVVFAGAPPGFVEAVASSEPAELARRCARVDLTVEALTAALDPVCRRVSITDEKGTRIAAALYLLREDCDAAYLFVCNTGEDFASAAGGVFDQPRARDRRLAFEDVRIRGFDGFAGKPVELDPATGAAAAAVATRTGGGWEIRTSLPELGSRLYVLPRRAGRRTPPAAPVLRTVRIDNLGADWEISLSEPSCLVLDRPRFRIGNGDWRGPDEILRVDREVRDAMGLRPRGGEMVQPWARPPVTSLRRVPVALSYTFRCEARPRGEVAVAMERPHSFRLRLNGTALATDAESGWWVDRSLRRVPFDPALLRVGNNELSIETDYAETDAGLEIVYLLGAFGTRADGASVVLTALPLRLTVGDWVPQGLAFYSGSVSYRRMVALTPQPGERVFVRVPGYRGVAFRVLVNGAVAGVSGWAPHEIEVTALLGPEPVELQIEIVGHRRNSHGPFHISDPRPKWTGPGQFTCGAEEWLEGYQLVPCGIMREPELIVRGD